MNPTKGLPAWGAAVIVVIVLALAWWLIPGGSKNTDVADQFPADDFPSTYKELPSKPTLIRGAAVLTGADKELEHADVLMSDGKNQQVDENITSPAGAVVVDGKGKFGTPGIIDRHSHPGVYSSTSN